MGLQTLLTGPKPKEIKVETFRIDYLIRAPKVEKLSKQPISLMTWGIRLKVQRFGFGVSGLWVLGSGFRV